MTVVGVDIDHTHGESQNHAFASLSDVFSYYKSSSIFWKTRRGYVGTTKCDVTVRNSMNNLHFRIFLSKVKTQLQLRHKRRVEYVHKGRLLIYKRAR